MHRLVNQSLDFPWIELALRRLEVYAAKYGWVGTVSFAKALASIKECHRQGNAYMVQGYLVLVDEITPWYTEDKVLQEWLVLKIYDLGADISVVPDALQTLAAQRGCALVVTADSSPVNIVAKAYSAAGFKPLTTSFYKAVTPWDF